MSLAGKVAVVYGTRPEIIKLAPVITQLVDDAFVVDSGQHYDHELSGQYRAVFGIGEPDVRLDGVGGKSRAEQISRMLVGLTRVFEEQRPGIVLVQGDTNTVSAAAQAANYLGIPVGHVEAGLRSYDRAMPEEINRLVAGALSDVHFAPTRRSAVNLINEGVDRERVMVTGNTVVEATHRAIRQSARPVASWFPNGSIPPAFAVATIHRPENTDSAPALARVLRGLQGLAMPVLFFVHPRTRAAIERFGLQRETNGLIMHPSPGSADFLQVLSAATVVVSDSGGVQEESTVLKVPVAVVRKSTERPEAVDAGWATLVRPGTDIATAVARLLRSDRPDPSVPTPYGDGAASLRIAAVARLIAEGREPAVALRLASDHAGQEAPSDAVMDSGSATR
ncbi:non-hydrolyzing UDP-N-acetylglucosamine 2-epimerase [Microbacterium sp. RURRCA19A]|uniref:non-hydrolyzing UDP-N-acetylglucosamine 2-epimerase n=1 Tax=Microbacterium sp. RURRCA19A TaxID=1907391 RepID=UPI0009558F34|nr:UDP-N-acetylglucosamine 2-epimerase (non-hydrolyzing) [Microbacterium sp. RURRCA19A]SIR93759.1 UDP-N-acetylglucosamine 2-epimerase (non-hydrolysing) [Microbacterium sp. RURRCA19A]